MNKSIWELCENPSAFIDYRWESDHLPERKFYLVLTEIGRQLRHLMTDSGPIQMFDLCEQCAEGLISEGDLAAVAESLRASSGHVNLAVDEANNLYFWVADRDKTKWEGVYPAANAPAYLAACDAGYVGSVASHHEYDTLRMHPVFAFARHQTENEWGGIVRDIYGTNPFAPVAFDPSWRTEAVVAVARGMYESRDFAAMPVLADALDDAGCDNAEILAHCRGAGPHVRGCWVVDLVLGKA